MSESSQYSLTLDGQQVTLDWPELVELARTGRVTPASKVTTPSGSTVLAGDLPGPFGGQAPGTSYWVGSSDPLPNPSPNHIEPQFSPPRNTTPVWVIVVLVVSAITCICCFSVFFLPGILIGNALGHLKDIGAFRETGPAVGALAPTFKAADRSGKLVHFPADFKGKVVMIDFWATWCEPCMEEMPNVAKQYAAHHGEGFEILGVSLDDSGSISEIHRISLEKNMTWDEIADGKGWDTKAANLYGVHGIPSAFLVDGTTGKIVAEGFDVQGDALGASILKAIAAQKAEVLAKDPSKKPHS